MEPSRNITEAKAIEILKEHGTELTIEEAEAVLGLMYKFADIALRQLKNTDQKSLSDQQSDSQGT